MKDRISGSRAARSRAGWLYIGIGAAIIAAGLLFVDTKKAPEPSRALVLQDVIGGNARYREIQAPAPGAPIPLPNPAVAQIKTADAQTRTLTVRLGVKEQTEVQARLDVAQVILYTWHADGEVYTDFHGHQPDAGKAFVRYEEQQSGRAGRGSLVAPFDGEHGWYWRNLAGRPVTITLTVTGYYRDIVDHGIFK